MGREIVKELVQEKFNGQNLANAIQELLTSKTARQAQLDNQNRALKLMGLGKKTAAQMAAEFLFEN